MDHHAHMPQAPLIPRPALMLGWLGVAPFLTLTLAAVMGSPETASTAGTALVAYATIILSFMGGAQWGLAVVAAADASAVLARRLAVSVLPALAALASLALPARAALLGLAAAFVALLTYDIASARKGVAPGWYPALRVQLTIAVVLCLLVAAGLGRV